MCLGIPGKVVHLEENDLGMLMGKVDFGGVLKEVCLVYVPEVKLSDYVIVHAGFALNVIEEDEAMQVFEMLHQFHELDGLEVQVEPGASTSG